MLRLLQLLLISTLLLSAAAQASGAAPHRIATSVAPLGWLIEQIGADRVEVEVLIPAGASPETFAPRPGALERVSNADLYVAVGHPHFMLEQTTLAEAIASTRVVNMNTASGGGESARDLALDPHIWLSPNRFSRMAHAIAEALAELDPAHATEHRARTRGLQAKIEALDADIRARLERGPSEPRILVLHPAWGWYAQDYGIEQIAIEHEGKAPGPRALIPLIENARRDEIRRIYVQPGFPNKSASLVAREIGGELVEADPLARDWLANMQRVSILFSGGTPGAGAAGAGR